MSIGSCYLSVWNGQVLVFVLSEMSSCVYGAVVGLLSIVLVEDLVGFSPAYEVEESLTFHAHLQATLHLDNLQRLSLVVVAFVGGDIHLHAIVVLIVGDDAGALLGALPQLVDEADGLWDASVVELYECLGTFQEHVSIAEDDAVLGCSPPGALDEIGTHEVRVYILLEGDIMAIQTVGAAPSGTVVHDVFGIELIRQSGHADGEEEARVGIVGAFVIVLLIVGVEQGQSVGTSTVGVDKILARLIEVATTIGDAGDIGYDQTVAPIEVAIFRTVVL